MKHIPVKSLALFLWCWTLGSLHSQDQWRTGALLGAIVTSDGKHYEGCKLIKVETDGITILHGDDSIKIPMGNLPDKLRARFQYSPDKQPEVKQQKKYELEIAILKQRIIDLENRITSISAKPVVQTPPVEAQPEQIQPSVQGFNRFLDEQRNLSGGKRLSGGAPKSKAGWRYTQGPWKDLTPGDGEEKARKQWEAMSNKQKMVYENQARYYSGAISVNPISKPETKSSSTTGPYSIINNGLGNSTVIGPDGKSYNVINSGGGVINIIPMNPD